MTPHQRQRQRQRAAAPKPIPTKQGGYSYFFNSSGRPDDIVTGFGSGVEKNTPETVRFGSDFGGALRHTD